MLFCGYMLFTIFQKNTLNDDTVEILTQLKCGFSFSLDSMDITAADWNDKCHALPRFDCNEFAHGQRKGG